MKKIYTALFLAIVPSIARLQAQNTLYVKATNGTNNSYAVSNVRKVTYPSADSMKIETNQGTTTYSFNNVNYFSFITTSIGIQQNAIQQGDLLFFPNPVNDKIQISYQSEASGVLQLEIIDMCGREVLQQTLSDQYGKNLFTINVAHLSQGLYVCRVQNGNRFETVKFNKN
jgi:hypothetical protein